MANEVAVHAVYLEDSTMIHAFNLKQGGPDALPTGHTGIPKGFSPQKIVDKILAAANGNKIKILRLLAHGDAGEFDFPGIEDRSSVSSKYTQLRKAFAPLARIEVHGCGCASEEELDGGKGEYTGDRKGRGLLFLWAVAKTFNVPVTGAVDTQGGWDGWGYSGVTVTISPAGKFYAQKPGQRWWDPGSANEQARREFDRIETQYIKKKLYAQARAALRNLIQLYPTSKEAAEAKLLLPADAMEQPNKGLATKFE
ncbi:hypothetical protein ACQKLX_24560 [Bosea sp. NPDC003192]|jgi:hypothetical protein|uniref:hypothetical protein n=1 Tax=Bosea sp. NPDC003192 TaxID=3390551 RepID=UPI003CFFBE45